MSDIRHVDHVPANCTHCCYLGNYRLYRLYICTAESQAINPTTYSDGMLYATRHGELRQRSLASVVNAEHSPTVLVEAKRRAINDGYLKLDAVIESDGDGDALERIR